LADLCSLHGTYSTMRCMCGHSDVGWRLSIEGIRDEISWLWDPTAHKAFLAMLTGLGNLEACFFSGIKAVFMENRGCNDLRSCRGLSIRHLAIQRQWRCRRHYMRWVAGGGSATSRWLSNEGCLPLCEKVTRAIHSSTWYIWGEPLPPPTQVRGDQPCAGNDGCCGVDKGWLRISLFAAKTVGSAAKR
jgi:hypothetical protein